MCSKLLNVWTSPELLEIGSLAVLLQLESLLELPWYFLGVPQISGDVCELAWKLSVVFSINSTPETYKNKLLSRDTNHKQNFGWDIALIDR